MKYLYWFILLLFVWEGFCSSLFIFLLKKKNGGMITSVMKKRKFKRCECCWTHLRVKFIKGRCECAYYHTGVFKEMCRREHWCSHDIYRPVIYIEPSVSKRIWTEITVHTPQKKSIWTRLKDWWSANKKDIKEGITLVFIMVLFVFLFTSYIFFTAIASIGIDRGMEPW